MNFASRRIFKGVKQNPTAVVPIRAVTFNFRAPVPVTVVQKTLRLTLSRRGESRRDAFTGQLGFAGDANAASADEAPLHNWTLPGKRRHLINVSSSV